MCFQQFGRFVDFIFQFCLCFNFHDIVPHGIIEGWDTEVEKEGYSIFWFTPQVLKQQGLKSGTWNAIWVCHNCVIGPESWTSFCWFFPGASQGAGLEVDHSVLGLAPMWDPMITGRSLTHWAHNTRPYAQTLCPVLGWSTNYFLKFWWCKELCQQGGKTEVQILNTWGIPYDNKGIRQPHSDKIQMPH